MKPFTAIVFCAVVAFATISSTNAASLSRVRRQAIPKEFANINIENYLKNERAVAFQLKCIVYDGPCDRIGKYLKVTIPELLTNQCTNCDPAQRQRAGRLVQHIQQKFPKEWADAIQKFQGGQVKKADADRLESLLGVKLDSKLVATEAPVVTTVAPTTTAAPSTTAAPVVALVDVSTTAAPVASSTSAAPATAAPVAESTTTAVPSSSVAPAVVSSEAPVVVTSSAAPAVAASSSVAPEVSSTAAPVSSSAAPVVVEVSSTAAPSTSEAPASSPAPSVAPVSPSSSSPATTV